MNLKQCLAPSLFVLSLAACSADTVQSNTTTGDVATSSTAIVTPVLGSFGVALENMDLTVKPGDNFFKYVNGTWLRDTEIPADKSNYGGFSILTDLSDERVKAIIEDTSKSNSTPGSEEQKIGDFYAAFMDASAIQNAGLDGVRADLGVDVDVKDIKNYIFYITQSGLGMPNRDYYLDSDEKSEGLRTAYLALLTTMLSEAGDKDAAASASNVMAFETQMAKVHWKPAKRRDRSLTYNKMTIDEMKAYAKGFPWDDFEFYGKALRGTEVQRDRWKRAVGQIDNMMGEMVGKVYVKRHFPPIAKTQMDVLVENLRSAFKDGIDNLEWMGADTKTEAQDKLRKFNPKIGYPDEWTDYTSLSVDRADLIGTVKSANRWQWEDMIGKLGGPIDRGEWGMNPQTVNAYYRPSLNEIVFPAAILQAPFFDPAADAAVNYGGIGAVIGHEMGHGFDDQGRKTDGNGQQRDWWTEADGAAFKQRSDALVEQFNAFEPLPGLNVNGQLTLGENIGDLTGLTMAYAAYKKSLNGKEAPIIDGFTGDQRFFLSYGQIWQRKFRDAALRTRVKTDPHSPGEYRANGIVRNFDAWYEAFDVQPGDALYLPPEKRVKIW